MHVSVYICYNIYNIIFPIWPYTFLISFTRDHKPLRCSIYKNILHLDKKLIIICSHVCMRVRVLFILVRRLIDLCVCVVGVFLSLCLHTEIGIFSKHTNTEYNKNMARNTWNMRINIDANNIQNNKEPDNPFSVCEHAMRYNPSIRSYRSRKQHTIYRIE